MNIFENIFCECFLLTEKEMNQVDSVGPDCIGHIVIYISLIEQTTFKQKQLSLFVGK